MLMNNNDKQLEDDFIGNDAPFMLKIPLEFYPKEAESLLGFMPKDGTNTYIFEDFPDKRYFSNIERNFGTLILNMLGEVVDDYDNGIKMYRPNLLPINVSGNYKTGFVVELEFLVVVECLNKNKDYGNLRKALVAACLNGWELE